MVRSQSTLEQSLNVGAKSGRHAKDSPCSHAHVAGSPSHDTAVPLERPSSPAANIMADSTDALLWFLSELENLKSSLLSENTVALSSTLQPIAHTLDSIKQTLKSHSGSIKALEASTSDHSDRIAQLEKQCRSLATENSALLDKLDDQRCKGFRPNNCGNSQSAISESALEWLPSSLALYPALQQLQSQGGGRKLFRRPRNPLETLSGPLTLRKR
ncbi:hypothetical protein AOLI_G00057900 [Acnodon oligacanthus]